MSSYTGQTSQFQPAVVLDMLADNSAGVFHMLFVSRDSTNRLLHTFAPGFGPDEGLAWEPFPTSTGQTTHAAPAIALYQKGADATGESGLPDNYLFEWSSRMTTRTGCSTRCST